MRSTPATSTHPRRSHPRHSERGATLIVALVAVVALLGIGMVTMLTVRSDTVASGSDRFQQLALYAAESGAAAGIDFLRQNCMADGSFYTQFLGQTPTGIAGNGVQPGAAGNPFDDTLNVYYQVTIENNESELDAADDTDGIVVLHAVGYGPNSTQVTIEVEVQSPSCVANFCAGEFAQKNEGSLNDTEVAQTSAVCIAAQITQGGWRDVNLGGS